MLEWSWVYISLLISVQGSGLVPPSPLVSMEKSPPCLKVFLPVKHGSSYSLLLRVDSRVGHVIAGLEPPLPSSSPLSSRVQQTLSELEQALAADQSALSNQLDLVQ